MKTENVPALQAVTEPSVGIVTITAILYFRDL